jgi:hypothetical protein
MRAISVTGELNDIRLFQAQRFLEAPANLQQDFFALLYRASLSSGVVAITTAWDWATDRPRPQTDAVEALANVDDNAHDFAVALILEGFANGGEHHMQPELIDVDDLLVFELERPLSAMLILGVFPFGADASLEQVIISLQCEFGGGSDVVLNNPYQSASESKNNEA